MQQVGGLSAGARQLLRGPLGSVEKIEILSMLARAPGQAASIVDLARDARLPPAIAKRVVGELEQAQFVEVTTRGLVRVAVRERDREAANEILEMYAEEPASVKSLLAARR